MLAIMLAITPSSMSQILLAIVTAAILELIGNDFVKSAWGPCAQAIAFFLAGRVRQLSDSLDCHQEP